MVNMMRDEILPNCVKEFPCMYLLTTKKTSVTKIAQYLEMHSKKLKKT